MTTLEEYKQNLSQKQQEVSSIKEQYSSKQALLQNRGLKGYVQRQKVQEALTPIASDISSAERGVSDYESRLKSYQEKIDEYESEKNAYEKAKKMWKKKIPYGMAKGTREYKYLKELWERKGSYSKTLRQKEEFLNEVKKTQEEFNVDKTKAIQIIANPEKELQKIGGYGMSRPEGEGIMVNDKFYITKPNEKYNEYAATLQSRAPEKKITPLEQIQQTSDYYKSIGYRAPTKTELFLQKVADIPSKVGNWVGGTTEKVLENTGFQPLTISKEKTIKTIIPTKQTYYEGAGEVEVVLPKQEISPKSIGKTAAVATPFVIYPLRYVGATILGAQAGAGVFKLLKGKTVSERGRGVAEIVLPAAGYIFGKSLTKKVPKFSKVPEGEDVLIKQVVTKEGQVFNIYGPQQASKPIITTKEVRRPISIGDQTGAVGRFNIKAITPEQKSIEKLSLIKKIFFSPKEITSAPERIERGVSTNIYVNAEGEIVGNPFYASQRKGAKLTNIFTLEGKSVQFAPEDFGKLPEQTQQIVIKRIEERIGIPVSKENAPGLMRAEDLFSFGEVTSQRILRLSPSNKAKPAQLIPYGKRRTISAVVAKEKPIIQNEQAVLYKSELSAVDISKPTRISGDIESRFGKPSVDTSKGAKEFLKAQSSKGMYFPSEKKVLLPNKRSITGKVGKHEFGHYYDDVMKTLKEMSSEEKAALLSEARSKLQKRYGKDYAKLYSTEESQMKEGIAMRYEERGIIKPLKEIPSRTQPVTMKGTSLEIKEPIRTGDSDVGGLVLKKKQTTAMKSLKDVMQKAQVSVAKNLPKPSRNVPRLTPAEKGQNQFVKAIPKQGFIESQSPYYGKGQYELTEGGGSFQIQTREEPSLKEVSIIKPSQVSSPIETEVLKQPTFESERLSSNLKEDILSVPRESFKQPSVEVSSSRLKEELKEMLKQRQTELLKSQAIQTQTGKGRIIPTKKGTSYGFNLRGSSSAKERFMNQARKAYNVIVWKRGKEEIIGKNLPEGRAKQLGVKEVLRTLRASFKLKPTGTTTAEDIDYKVPSRWFVPAKRDTQRYVQRRETRFGARTETKEAQLFRKQARGKLKWW